MTKQTQKCPKCPYTATGNFARQSLGRHLFFKHSVPGKSSTAAHRRRQHSNNGSNGARPALMKPRMKRRKHAPAITHSLEYCPRCGFPVGKVGRAVEAATMI